MVQNRALPDKFIIRNASLTIYDYGFFICVLILFFFIIKGQYSEFASVIILGLLGFTVYRIIKRLQDRSDKIIIDKDGIKICDTNDFISWSKIKYAYIKQKSEGVGKSARLVDYFHIDTNEGEIQVKMTEFKYKQDLLVQAVEHFSGRNIGELTDLLNDNAKIIIGTDRNINRISKLLTDYYKRQINLVLISLFTLIGISIYLQIVIDYPYVFAIGFAFSMGVIYLIGILEEKRLRNQEYICELNDNKFKELIKEYGKGYDREMSKPKKVASIIFLIILALAIFGISYMFEREKEKQGNRKDTQINSLPNVPSTATKLRNVAL